jgi:hypothetical protein
MGLGSLLFAMPHFLTESYNPATSSSATSGGDWHPRNVALCNMTTSCGIEEAVSSRAGYPVPVRYPDSVTGESVHHNFFKNKNELWRENCS